MFWIDLNCRLARRGVVVVRRLVAFVVARLRRLSLDHHTLDHAHSWCLCPCCRFHPRSYHALDV